MHYQVFGVDRGGKTTLVKSTRFAREARRVRDLDDSFRVITIIYGSECELTTPELDQLAALDHRYV